MSAREVELTDGAPWGFRMHGGVDQNQPLRISRVNPGRKASLSGIREGDVITSINGRTTKEMSNADAHAMLRSAGPVLRLGLNEDREMSPRRRSIGKATELKRPFQLIDINEKATPHPPVYATIRQPNSPNKLPSKPLSTHPTLNSTHLVKSFEDTPKFHPTNPFYSTLPNTKLPIPNGKSNALQRSVNRTDSYNDDLKLSSFFRKNDSGLSIPNIKYSQSNDTSPKRFLYDKYNSYSDKESSNGDPKTKRNPFDNVTKDGFNHSDKANSSNGAKSMIYSKSDNNFHRNEEIIKHSSITEEKVNETEEIKIIKKLTLNGSIENDKTNGITKPENKLFKFHSDHNIHERIIPTTLENEESLNKKFDNKKNGQEMVLSSSYQSPREEYKVGEAQSGATPPVQSPSQVTAQGNTRAVEDNGSCSNENTDIPTGSVVQNEIDNSKLLETDNSLGSQSEECSIEKLNKKEVSECITKVGKEEIDASEKYIVETPEQISKPKVKLDNAKKSKSCDDDDSPKIVEVTEEYNSQGDESNIPLIDSNKVIVTTEEPEIEWEKTEEFNLQQTEKTKGILSNNYTISLDVAHCEQTKSLSPEEESSLRNYLHTLNLSTNPHVDTADIKTEIEQIINREIKYRLRRKGLAEETFFERSGPSRSLAVIDEEGSGDSSKTSRRQSYLSDKKSDTEELEDDVFESKETQAKRRRDTNFPLNLSMRRVIPQQCIRVDAKLKEPEVSEARGDWKMETVEKIIGAELVYLTDSSSSTSSIYDVSDDGDKGHETDVSVRMITPTIEVTDTESLLKNTFLTKCNDSNINKINENHISIINETEETTKTDQKNNLFMDTDDVTETDNNYKNDPHEIIVLSTDDIKTSLFVKDINEVNDCTSSNIVSDDTIESDSKNNIALDKNSTKSLKEINNYDLEIKVLKCELNDAINNLIKEVVSDAENTSDSNGIQDTTVIRQDSSSSLDSSQCTAKYNPTYSSLNDVSSFLRNESHEDLDKDTLVAKTSSHVKDVIEHVENNIDSKLISAFIISQPCTLRNICLKKISSLPYGEKVLEELANVSKRLQDISISALNYSNIDNLQLNNHKKDDLLEKHKTSGGLNNQKENKPVPPPVKPRKSSLKKGQDEQRFTVPPKPEKVYECLSPSQKMLMEKTNTVIRKDDIIQTPKTHIEENKSIHKENDSSILPMKSETGSRLLALLRNSPAPRKSSLPTLNDENYFPKSKTTSSRTETFSKRLLKEIDESNNFKDTLNNHKYPPALTTTNFKPIPPPKPRKVFTYETDSEFTDSSYRSIRSDKKVFHYSTGNLNEEIENDISSIQNLHRQCTNLRNNSSNTVYPRRPSLPKDLCDQQMEYIRQKEKEVEAEIKRLEQEQHKTSQRRGPRAPMISEKDSRYGGFFETKYLRDNISNYPNSTNLENRKISSQFSSSQEELLREKMYTEYVNQMAEREQRKNNKVIKVTQSASRSNLISKSMPSINYLDSKVNNRIEQEFISKAKERWCKLGIRDTETEDEDEFGRDVYREPKVIEHKIKVIEDGEEKDVKKLPSHMQEFVRFTVKDKDEDTCSNETVMIAPTFKARSSSPAIWRPGLVTEGPPVSAGPPPPPPPPVWSPSATPQTPRKFRPVHFEDTPPERRKFGSSDQNGCTSGSESEGRLRTSLSAPASGLNSLSTSRLPRAQNPTVTLLQKAREGQLQRGRNSQQESDPRLPRDRPSPPRGDPVHALRKEYASESEAERSDYERGGHKMSEAKKIEGIGPTTKDGMPVALRSEVKDPSRWYKKMYDTIHKNKYDEDYVTIRYKNSRGETLQRPSSNRSQYAYFDPRSGYLSEPEGARDLTAPRRRTASVQGDHDKYSTLGSSRVRHEVYNNRPGRIEDYVPGKSSVIDKEAKQWWDEVMDIFDGQNESMTPSQTQPSPKDKKDITSAILSKSNMARALKESGYESDSTLVFRRGEAAPLSPAERRAAYRDLQAGGEPPRGGFRSPAPHRHDESEIEYIPISSTLTKIRIHKKAPQMHEVICYPVTSIDKQYLATEQSLDRKNIDAECVPIPPARISSRNSRTLKLVTSTRQASICPKMEQSNVEFLKNKISNKLSRQHTHTIIKRKPVSQNSHSRIMSTSAPPVLNRNKSSYGIKNTAIISKNSGTSSFSSPRRTIMPVNYPDSKRKSGETYASAVIEGGAGRRTPITNILDKMTALDKLWGSQKRNERIDVSKIKPKSIIKTPSKQVALQKSVLVPKLEAIATHKSRDMIRTSEKVQKMKIQAKSTPCLAKPDTKSVKSNVLQTMSNISKSSSNLIPLPKKQNTVKIATVTNLKKKKPLESGTVKIRNTPPHEQNIKKLRHHSSKKIQKCHKTPHKKQRGELHSEIETGSQFGDNLDRISNNGSSEFLDMQISKDLKKARNAIVSDSFFQHLFLRDGVSMPNSIIPGEGIPNTVLQKAKYFQTLPETSLNYSNSLNTYLVHRKPVSLSRFKMWDRQSSPLPIQNPRSISWPGKMDGRIRKFESLTKCTNEFGSSSSLSTVRSKSEPPSNKLYFSQTSRPISPTVTFHKRQESPIKKSPSPVRFLFPLPTRSMAPNVMNKTRKLESLSRSPTRIIFSNTIYPGSHSKLNDNFEKSLKNELREKNDINPGTIFFSETTRPVSPKVVYRAPLSRSQSTSPAPIRSPSYRRIHNARVQNKLETVKKEFRTRSAENIEKEKGETVICCRPKSDSNLYEHDPEYDEYINDIQNMTGRSVRFRELNRYYSYLERVAELEKTTANQNTCYRKKDEEIIDFDRWKKIRTIERAEEELNNLYTKLKKAQNENDIFFYPRDVNDFRWNFNRERGLRMKEKSVEDLKEELEQKTIYDMEVELDCSQTKDTYKPLWRGTSVAETAFTINKKNELENKNTAKNVRTSQSNHLSDLRKKIGLGSRLWSSLSMDQVNALKNQLNAIYSKEFEAKSNLENDNFAITVENAKNVKQPALHVRCSSLITPKKKSIIPELNKSESIAAISFPMSSEKEIKNNVNKMQMSLTESEKKKISQSLSKELLNRMNKYDTVSPKSEIEKPPKIEVPKKQDSKASDINNKLIAENNESINEKKRHVIFPISKVETSNLSSASENETGSSDISGKTVIYKGPAKEVKKKVQYFESVSDEKDPATIIYRPKEDVNEKKVQNEQEKTSDIKNTKSDNNQIFQSQSCSNLKELFGESEKNKYLSLPSKTVLYSRSPSPQSEVYVSDRRTPDTLRFSSDETIWRSRTPSPDPERYWRAYLKLAREGEVRRLARRFDSPSAAGAVLRRYRSDPEIIRNDINNSWFTDRSLKRGKCRSLLPVARMPLRPSNRFMPHIDVISKLAALRKRNTTRSRSAEEVLECRPGEVERIRRRFEAMSLLGQIYTSAPDVCELHNISSYLAGPWIAHRYPKPEDNNKSIPEPGTTLRGRTSIKKDKSKPKEPVNLNSILKTDSLAKQAFNPLAHQPASRYEPPRTPPRPPSAAWPYRLAPYVTPLRHTVTFQESDSAPEPPRRASHGSYSDSESPNRRYVESDVNIHYRCPVRHDPLPLVPERELALQQADHMKRLYREQRRNKYLQENSIHHLDIDAFDASIKELQDMQNRRHQDNFMPSQKAIVPLNRYDEAERIVAKALYTFNGQTTRELSFRKGDIINVRRQIDSNWYEGEVHGKVGLFPYNYVELMKGDGVQTLKKTSIIEGRARAKFDFIAQTNLELPLKKGEVVVLTRRIDHNWWEGRTGNKTGIFPDSYVTILQEPSQNRQDPPAARPLAPPAVQVPPAHRYTPQHNSPALSNAPPATAPLPSNGSGRRPRGAADLNNTEPLYVDTNAEAVPYRAMYKYCPQNPDELELCEGDTVYVLEKCDDGWYVGSSQRSGRFGTFPGNYVERI